MMKARLLYFLEVIIERAVILLFTFDKYIQWRLGTPVLVNTHGIELIMYMTIVLILVLTSYILFTRRSIIITWILLLKKDVDKNGHYQKITDEIEERA